MAITFVPVTETVGVEVRECDLKNPLSESDQVMLRSALHEHGLLLFRGLDIDAEQQLRFALYFGNISKQGAIQQASPPISYVSNTRADGAFGKGELSFHSDQAYYEQPMKAIMLYGLDVTSQGGETLFVNTARIVADLPEEKRARFSKLRVRHELDYGGLDFGKDLKGSVKADKPTACHHVIAKHPWSDAMVLMSNCNTAKEILGVPADESAAILKELDKLVDDPARIYRHQWRKGDLIIWDNILLQHARTEFDASETRTLRRCAIGMA